MKIINIVLLILSTLFVFNCTPNSILQAEYQGSDGIILGNSGDIGEFKFDRYKLNNLEIVGDSIIINLSYSGGCRDHVYNLIAKDYFGDPEEPKAELVLSHDSKLDPCEAYPTEDHTFNLLPLKYEFVKMFGKESGAVRLILKEMEVVYSF